MADAELGMEAIEGEEIGVSRTYAAFPNLAPCRAGRNIVGRAAVYERDDVVALHYLLKHRLHVRIFAGHVVVKKAGNRGREPSRVDRVEIPGEFVPANDDFFDDPRIDEADRSNDLRRNLRA